MRAGFLQDIAQGLLRGNTGDDGDETGRGQNGRHRLAGGIERGESEADSDDDDEDLE